MESTAAGPGTSPVKKPTTVPRAIGAADWRLTVRRRLAVVGSRALGDDRQPPARRQHAAHLGEGDILVRDVAQTERDARAIEACASLRSRSRQRPS